MLVAAQLPKILDLMNRGLVTTLSVAEGDVVKKGDPLYEVQVDLSDGLAQACPPISDYRVISRESGIVRKLCVSPGTVCLPGEVILLVTKHVDDSFEGEPSRRMRTVTARFRKSPFE